MNKPDTSPEALRASADGLDCLIELAFLRSACLFNAINLLRTVADEKETQNFNKQELVEILREAATIIHALTLLPGDPIDIRLPIVDELIGFAYMFEAASEGPKT